MRIADGPWWNRAKRQYYATFNKRKVSLKTDDRKEAKRIWHLWNANPELIPPPRNAVKEIPKTEVDPTFGMLARSYQAFQMDRISDVTRRGEAERIRAILKRWEMTRASAFDVEAFAAWVRGQNQWGTTRRADISLMTMKIFRYAVKRDLIPASPLKDLDPGRARSRGGDVVVSPDKLTKYLAACSGALRDIVGFLFETGVRPSEAVRMTSGDVDLDNRIVRLKLHKTSKKTGRDRIIPLSQEAIRIIRERVKSNPDPLLFRSPKGTAWTVSNLGRRMRTISDRTGIRVIGYAGRHTTATRLLEGGVSDSVTAAILGHGSTAMVHRNYSHLAERSRSMLAAIDGLQASSGVSSSAPAE